MINGRLRTVAEALDNRAILLPETTNQVLRLIRRLCAIAKRDDVFFEAHDDNSDWENPEELLIDVVLSGHVKICPCIDLANSIGSQAVIICWRRAAPCTPPGSIWSPQVI